MQGWHGKLYNLQILFGYFIIFFTEVKQIKIFDFKHFRFAVNLDGNSKQSGFNFQPVDLT